MEIRGRGCRGACGKVRTTLCQLVLSFCLHIGSRDCTQALVKGVCFVLFAALGI